MPHHVITTLTVWIISWACLLANLTAGCTQARCSVKRYHFSRHRQSVENSALTGYVFTTLTVSGHKKCFEECALDCRCVSFNFGVTANRDNCQLNTENRYLMPSALKTKEGFSYHDLEIEYNVKTESTCTQCHNNCCHTNPCLNDGVCVETCDATKGRFQCNCRPGYKGRLCEQVLRNCAELNQHGPLTSGVYKLDPADGQGAFDAFCDRDSNGEVWVVFQRRLDGSVDFYRGWKEYTNGFGNLNGEFWLGLEKIHRLTNQNTTALRIELQTFTGYSCIANYNHFTISGADENYKLTSVGRLSGDCIDSLSYSEGSFFSTKDKDLDSRNMHHCAVDHRGAWWYSSCTQSNLNGRYLPANASSITGVYWFKDRSSQLVPLKTTSMKLKIP